MPYTQQGLEYKRSVTAGMKVMYIETLQTYEQEFWCFEGLELDMWLTRVILKNIVLQDTE